MTSRKSRSKFNQSQQVERWSRQLKNYDKSAPLQHLPGTLLDPEAIDSPDKSLQEPLLDGGQGEKFSVKCALVELQGDVNVSARPNNNKPLNIPNNGYLIHPPNDKPPNIPDNGYSMHPNDRGNVTELLSHPPRGEQETATPLVQAPGPDASGQRVGKQANRYDALKGQLPPVIKATGAEVVSRDIEKL
jgi:hypothetical protein